MQRKENFIYPSLFFLKKKIENLENVFSMFHVIRSENVIHLKFWQMIGFFNLLIQFVGQLMKFIFLKSGLLSMALNRVLTPVIAVNLEFLISLMKAGIFLGSVMRIFFEPLLKNEKIQCKHCHTDNLFC